MTDPETLARVERLARAQCTPGEIACSLWSERLLTDRVACRVLVKEIADDITAWRLAGRAEVRVAAHDCAVGRAKLSPGQAAAQAAWGRQHLGWLPTGADEARQEQAEQREQAAATKLRAVTGAG